MTNIVNVPTATLVTINGGEVLGIFEMPDYQRLYAVVKENNKVFSILVTQDGCKPVRFPLCGASPSPYIISKPKRIFCVKTKSELLNEGWILRQDDVNEVLVCKPSKKYTVGNAEFGLPLHENREVTLIFINDLCKEIQG